MTEDPMRNEHWEIVACPDGHGRVHIRPIHGNEPFPLCWNRVAARSLCRALYDTVGMSDTVLGAMYQ
jgi:hypothetical protein